MFNTRNFKILFRWFSYRRPSPIRIVVIDGFYGRLFDNAVNLNATGGGQQLSNGQRSEERGHPRETEASGQQHH